MLGLGKTVRVRAVGRIRGLREQVRKISAERRLDRSRLREHKSRNIPGVSRGELRRQIARTIRHIIVDKPSGRDETRHSCAVVEAVWTPERRKQVAEIGARKASPDA